MKIFNVLIGVILLLLLILGGIVIYVVGGEANENDFTSLPPTFTVLDSGTAGGYGFVVYNYRGEGNLTLLSYNSLPKKNIVVINDSQAVQASQLEELIAQLDSLEKYGFNISVTETPTIGDDIYVVPSGALPSSILFNVEQNNSNGTIVYFGAKNLILSSGIKEYAWYDQLSPEQQSRFIIYGTTLDQFLDTGGSISQDLLYNRWIANENDSIYLSGNEISSSTVQMTGSGYVRLIYDVGNIHGIYDSPYMEQSPMFLNLSKQSTYPSEVSTLQFELNKTSGIAVLTVTKDGSIIETRDLRTVTDQNVFIETFSYGTPGNYIISIDDESSNLATGLLHVKDIQIQLLGRTGMQYSFLITIDNTPLESGEANVWLGNSTAQKKVYINDGETTISAQLDRGPNTFNFEIDGNVIQLNVVNNQTNILEFYLTYLVPGIFIVIIIYMGARMSRKPTYRVRFGDSSTYIRQEIRLPLDRALESFRKIREDMHLSGSPLTTHEFTISLKRYLTNGADVTEGNVEEILSKLVQASYLETHREYYQLKGEGDIKKKVLSRIIREKLIESGTQFTEQPDKFVLPDLEIGFFTSRFNKKAVIVVDNEAETKHIISSLDENQQARLRIAQTNGMLSFVTIDKLSGLL